MAVLRDEEIRERLSGLAGWSQEGNAIRKQYEFDDFKAAIAFVEDVAERAEAMNRHPDIEIHYSRVTLTLSTHSEGGVTGNDIEAAQSFEGAAS